MKINILFSSFISLASILENSVEANKADHFFKNHDNQMANRSGGSIITRDKPYPKSLDASDNFIENGIKSNGQICYKKEQTMATNYQPEEIDKNNWPIVSRTWSYGNAGKQTG